MADKLDLVFKKIVSRQYTSAVKRWYEENPGVPFKLKGSDVWVDTIPATPPINDTAVIKKYDTLTLVKDSTVGLNKSWVAEDPVDNTRIGDFIQPRYGRKYTVRLYDHVNKEIPTTDGCGWFFDYETGNLTFDSNPASFGWNATSFKIYGFRYCGSTTDDIWGALSNSVWQEPVISKMSEIPEDVGAGDRYIVRNPIPETEWEEHDHDIAVWDGFVWQFIPAHAGMITYIINEDKLYAYDDNYGWNWSGIDALDLDYNNEDSDLSAITVKAALDELDRLTKTNTTVLYVDNLRSDSYVETGTLIKPYKTFSAAVNNAISGNVIKVNPGQYDGDGLIVPDNVSLIGESASSVSISGNLVIGNTTNSKSNIEKIAFENITFNSECSFETMQANSVIINNNLNGIIFDIRPVIPIGDFNLILNAGIVNIQHGSINNVGSEQSIYQNGGELNLHNFIITGDSDNDLVYSINGIIRLHNGSIINNGSGKAAVIDNGAMSDNPNILADIYHEGDIHTCTSLTIVEGVTGGNPISDFPDNDNHIYRGGSQLKNESLIIKDEANGSLLGLTLNDSIDRVAQVVKYDQTLGGFIINTCVDDLP